MPKNAEPDLAAGIMSQTTRGTEMLIKRSVTDIKLLRLLGRVLRSIEQSSQKQYIYARARSVSTLCGASSARAYHSHVHVFAP